MNPLEALQLIDAAAARSTIDLGNGARDTQMRLMNASQVVVAFIREHAPELFPDPGSNGDSPAPLGPPGAVIGGGVPNRAARRQASRQKSTD